MNPNIQKDFFISYTSTDRPWAEWIAWQLEHEGYSVVIKALADPTRRLILDVLSEEDNQTLFELRTRLIEVSNVLTTTVSKFELVSPQVTTYVSEQGFNFKGLFCVSYAGLSVNKL